MPKLTIRQTDQAATKLSIKLSYKKVTIGRAETCDIVLTDPSISGRHCHISRVEGGFTVVDDNSTNGIKIDEKRFDVIDILRNREFLMGEVKVLVSYSNEEIDELSKEKRTVVKQKPKLPPLTG